MECDALVDVVRDKMMRYSSPARRIGDERDKFKEMRKARPPVIASSEFSGLAHCLSEPSRLQPIAREKDRGAGDRSEWCGSHSPTL